MIQIHIRTDENPSVTWAESVLGTLNEQNVTREVRKKRRRCVDTPPLQMTRIPF